MRCKMKSFGGFFFFFGKYFISFTRVKLIKNKLSASLPTFEPRMKVWYLKCGSYSITIRCKSSEFIALASLKPSENTSNSLDTDFLSHKNNNNKKMPLHSNLYRRKEKKDKLLYIDPSFFLAAHVTCLSSQARQNPHPAVTRTTAVTMPDP